MASRIMVGAPLRPLYCPAPNSITDPTVRENLRNEQERILARRGQEERPKVCSSDSFSRFFEVSGNDEDFPNY